MSAADTLALAVQHHQAGRLGPARDLYCHLLEADPRHADALQLLGTLSVQVGEPDLGARLIRQAIGLVPTNATYHVHLGIAERGAGRPTEALAALRRATELAPDHVDASCNLGAVLLEAGQAAEATVVLREALRRQPAHATAHNNLGNALKELGQLDEAIAAYRAALRVRPDYALAHNNLGNALKELGQLDEAITAYREALRLKPDYAVAHNNLGNALKDQGRFDDALASYRHALASEPGYVVAHINLGNNLRDLGQLDAAEASYREALRLRPDHADGRNNLAAVLQARGRLPEAAAELREVLRLRPDHALAHNNLGNVLKEFGQLRAALACYRTALRHQPNYADAHSNLLFALNYDPTADPAEVLAEHRRWATVHAPAPEPAPYANARDPGKRLRVGYVSPDLRHHAVARYFEPILAHHDPAVVETICFANVARPDTVTERLRSLAQGWRNVWGVSDAAVAEMVRRDGVDLLVDLAGHTAHHRLRVFALRPAPVQMTYLGYPNTTGLEAIRYRLTDAVLHPPGEPHWESEELVRLPGGSVCFQPPADAPDVAPSPATRNGYVTFGSLHSLAKLNADVFDLWCRVLRAVPESRMLLYRDTLTGEVRDLVRRQFTERGIAAGRVELRHGDGSDYLGVYGDVDVTLDVFPWGGGTTVCESLWMGVPVVTLCGRRFAQRGAATLLGTVGLSEGVATTAQEYVEVAQHLAVDWAGLAALRERLREQMTRTLCDGRRFIRELETAYREMWERWCRESLR